MHLLTVEALVPRILGITVVDVVVVVLAFDIVNINSGVGKTDLLKGVSLVPTSYNMKH